MLASVSLLGGLFVLLFPSPSRCTNDDAVADGSMLSPTVIDSTGSVQTNESNMAPVAMEESNCPMATEATVGEDRVHELGLDNFIPLIGSSTITLTLFYDGHDTGRNVSMQHEILNRLAIEFAEMEKSASFVTKNINISFATLDIRRHSFLRSMYADGMSGIPHIGRGDDYHHFYRNYADIPHGTSIPSNMMDSDLFMRLFYDEDNHDYHGDAGRGGMDKDGADEGDWDDDGLTGLEEEGVVGFDEVDIELVEEEEDAEDEWEHSDEDLEDLANWLNSLDSSLESLPTFPSRWVLFYGEDGDFNILDHIKEGDRTEDETTKMLVPTDTTDYGHVKNWLGDQVRKVLHFAMEGIGSKRLSFGGNEEGPIASISNKITAEKRRKAMYAGAHMDNINWTAAKEMKKDVSHSAPSLAPEDTFEVEVDDKGESFYKSDPTKTPIGSMNDTSLLFELMSLLKLYMSWADSYENLWDEERKDREDEQTNYGHHLKEMNQEVHGALLDVFDDIEFRRGLQLLRPRDVPNLRKFYEDIVFGYGRSPTSLEKYLKDVIYPRGPADSIETTEGVELFERIREFMGVCESADRSMYLAYFRTLLVKLSAILGDFQSSLSRHYLAHRDKNQRTKRGEGDRFQFQPLDVFDMNDPKNSAALSNYTYFEENYVRAGKPFVLSNAAVTGPYNYTFEFLVERCGYMDVKESIRPSAARGGNNHPSAGGHQAFELPEDLIAKNVSRNGNSVRNKISLEQFMLLLEHYDETLYLHDHSLIQHGCGNLLWSKTPYDPPEQQHFRIPSVVGSFDLLQRTAGDKIRGPFLFIGRRGTRSSTRLNSGAMGSWFFLASGRTRWVIYNPAERPFLYEDISTRDFVADVLLLQGGPTARDDDHTQNHFDAKFPLLHRSITEKAVYEFIQEPGQLVYIPPSAPYAFENLDDTVGISFNAVPRSGVAQHLWENVNDSLFADLEIELRYLMSSYDAREGLTSAANPLYVTLGEYVSQ